MNNLIRNKVLLVIILVVLVVGFVLPRIIAFFPILLIGFVIYLLLKRKKD